MVDGLGHRQHLMERRQDGDRDVRGVSAGEEHRGDRGGEREDAAHAEIDAAGEDDERHRQRENADQRDLPQDVGEIARLQEDA